MSTETKTVTFALPELPEYPPPLKSVVAPEQSLIRTNTDELVSVTNELAKVVSEVCQQIQSLKEEREDAVGETKDAYNLVIKNKVWTLQVLIGSYWRQTLQLELDAPAPNPADSHTVSTTFIDCKNEE